LNKSITAAVLHALSILTTRLNKVNEGKLPKFISILLFGANMKLKKLHVARGMMIATIGLIMAFQFYWIHKLYNDEWDSLKRESDVIFRETVYKLQVARFKKDTMFFKQSGDNMFNVEAIDVLKGQAKIPDGVPDDGKPKVIIHVEDTRLPEGMKIRVNRDTALKDNPTRMILPSTTSSEGGARKTTRIIYKSSLSDSAGPLNMDSIYQLMEQRIGQIQRTHDTNTTVVVQRVNAGAFLGKNIGSRTRSSAKTKIVRAKDSASKKSFARMQIPSPMQIFTTRSLNDSFSIKQLDSAYSKGLNKAGIKIPFTVTMSKTANGKSLKADSSKLVTQAIPVGLVHPVWYQASLLGATPYLLKSITPQIIFSLILVAFTIVTFIFLYRNVLAQQRLGEIKNDFISNITHELKTPIATVNVAIEAMKNFNALQSPERTKEYLDISSSELQRLSLLVDKVLKLSMFEKHEIELNREHFDLNGLVQEVMNSMRLQFEKCKGTISLHTSSPHTNVYADRLHITSVVYNLLDNGIKYCRENLHVDVNIWEEEGNVYLSVKDNGIGIDPIYKNKIFEKFFRVPSQDKHNTKGYGLGLSYVAHIIKQHKGTIRVESEPGVGSTFIIQLPAGGE
jgi:two-component system phosphate regulon sensor histidine kinase PhoR